MKLTIEYCRLQGKYYQINGQNYCEDHKDINIPKCSVCSQSLIGEFVNVNGGSHSQITLVFRH